MRQRLAVVGVKVAHSVQEVSVLTIKGKRFSRLQVRFQSPDCPRGSLDLGQASWIVEFMPSQTSAEVRHWAPHFPRSILQQYGPKALAILLRFRHGCVNIQMKCPMRQDVS